MIFFLFNHHPNPHLWVYKIDSRCCLYWQFLLYYIWWVCQDRDGRKTATKTRSDFVVASFWLAISTIVSCPFSERLEAGVWNQGILRILFWVLSASYVEIMLEAMIYRFFSYPAVIDRNLALFGPQRLGYYWVSSFNMHTFILNFIKIALILYVPLEIFFSLEQTPPHFVRGEIRIVKVYIHTVSLWQ